MNHHANLLLGSAPAAESYLRKFFDLKNSPDFVVFRESTFGIDEARKLSDWASRKAFGDKKIFLIIPERITAEAQNALLKTFEDPVPDTYFFLAIKEEALIIPTLRSRMQVLRVKHPMFDIKEAQAFLKLSPKDRLLFSKKFVDEEKNLSNFLDELLVALRNAPSIEEVYKLRKFADDRSASSRLILEHLSLVL